MEIDRHSCSLCYERDARIFLNEGSETALNRTLELAIKTFPCMQQEVKALAFESYLPGKIELMQRRDGTNYIPPREDFLRLLFLTTLTKEGNKYPVTEAEAKIFKACFEAGTMTRNWLGMRTIFLLAFLAGAAAGTNYFNYVTLLSQSNGTNSNSSSVDNAATKNFQVAMITALVAGIGFATNMAGLVFTGRNPDASSIAANKQQNRIAFLKEEYSNLAEVLIRLYFFHQELAVSIASEIDISLISEFINAMTHEEDAADLIGIDHLESIVLYIKSEGELLPCNQSIQNLILSLEKSRSDERMYGCKPNGVKLRNKCMNNNDLI